MKIYVDMDGVLCNYDKAFRQYFDPNTNKFPQAMPGFFLALEPMEGAIEGMNALARAGHDVYILTRPSIKNNHCWSEKAAWIEKHLGFGWLDKLIICSNKALLADGESYLIDDVIFSSAGQQVFDMQDKLIWFSERNTWPEILFILGIYD